MQTIISYIEGKRQVYERHAFFTGLLTNPTISGEKRLSWAPSIIPFIMGYSDLNKYVFRKEDSETAADPLQAMLNSHTYEEDFHWQWFLADLKKIGADTKMPLSDATRVLWSADFRHSRRLCLEITSLASHAPTYVLYAMVEALEATSLTFFKNCQGITMRNGEECEYFGTRHYIAEASHSINAPEVIESKLPDLTDDEKQQARVTVDRVFALFDDWLYSLLRYAREIDEHSIAYERIARHSRAVLPELENENRAKPLVERAEEFLLPSMICD